MDSWKQGVLCGKVVLNRYEIWTAICRAALVKAGLPWGGDFGIDNHWVDDVPDALSFEMYDGYAKIVIREVAPENETIEQRHVRKVRQILGETRKTVLDALEGKLAAARPELEAIVRGLDVEDEAPARERRVMEVEQQRPREAGYYWVRGQLDDDSWDEWLVLRWKDGEWRQGHYPYRNERYEVGVRIPYPVDALGEVLVDMTPEDARIGQEMAEGRFPEDDFTRQDLVRRNQSICKRCMQTTDDMPRSKYCEAVRGGDPDGKNQHAYERLDSEVGIAAWQRRLAKGGPA